MKTAFTTLGCPEWSWEQIMSRAAEMGYDGLELRGVDGEMDLPKAGPFLPQNLEATKARLEELGLAICCLGTSARFHEAETWRENVDLAKAHIDLAAKINAPFVRVFGDKIPSADVRDRIVDQVVKALIELADHAKGTGVKVIQETHGDFSRSEDILAVMKQVERPEVGVLWDLHHPFKFFDEKPADTWRNVGKYIVHTHVKDSTGTKEDYRYCLLGEGNLPIVEMLKLLKANGYDGWLSLEWEKKWHPEIEEPEVAFPQYSSKIQEYLKAL